MEGGKEKGLSMSLRSYKKGEFQVEDGNMDTAGAGCVEEANDANAMLGETASLASIRNAIQESMAKAMSELEKNIAKQLSDFQGNFQEDIKKQLGDMRTDINQRMEVTAGKMEAATERLEEAEQRIGEVETFDVEMRGVIINMQKTQHALKSKITELEGHSRRNNIRLYGIKEGVEGTSMISFVENLIKTELGESTGLNELGIERAHRALGPKPPESAPPRSTVVRFLRYTHKEKILSAAWKKPITVDGKRVFFDHDYASGVMEKRREYLPIKKVLKEKGIRFHTPLTKMRVFLDSGTVTYESADQAAEDLRAKGFPIPSRTEDGSRETTRLSSRWETAKAARRRDKVEYQHSIRDKLRGFQRWTDTDTTSTGQR